MFSLISIFWRNMYALYIYTYIYLFIYLLNYLFTYLFVHTHKTCVTQEHYQKHFVREYELPHLSKHNNAMKALGKRLKNLSC